MGEANLRDVSRNLRGKNVLVVDDNVEWSEVLKEMLEELEMAVDVAHNAADAIKKCLNNEPDLVIMDIKLEGSGCDGIDLAARLNETKLQAILLITGETNNGGFLEKAHKAKLTQYLLKPFKLEDLIIQIFMTLANFMLKTDLVELTRLLEERKEIDKAKRVLMKKKNIDEEAAYASMRKMSQDQNKPMVEIALMILTMQDLL